MQAGAVAVSDEDESAGTRLQHERKILRAHDRSEAIVDALLSDHLGGDRGRERRLPLVVTGYGIISLVVDVVS